MGTYSFLVMTVAHAFKDFASVTEQRIAKHLAYGTYTIIKVMFL